MRAPTAMIRGSKNRGRGPVASKIVNVTVSIGLADSKTTKKPEEVMKLADNALYKAKKRVVTDYLLVKIR